MDSKLYVAAGKYENQPVVSLRKAAQGKIKNAKRLRKPELVTALAEFDVRQAELEEANKALDEVIRLQSGESEAPRPAKKTAKKRCEVCGKRPVDLKTQGRDSTMCEPCYDYASWENQHSDDNHKDIQRRIADSTEPFTAKEEAEVENCPVCQGQNPADARARKNGSKPGRTVTKPAKVESKSFDAKAKAFASVAKAAGWSAVARKGNAEGVAVVTARSSDGHHITMVWENGAYQYNLSEYKDSKGHKAKIRNASAARRMLDA
jgi:hypothetical protein